MDNASTLLFGAPEGAKTWWGKALPQNWCTNSASVFLDPGIHGQCPQLVRLRPSVARRKDSGYG
jgi:hypothetical protein